MRRTDTQQAGHAGRRGLVTPVFAFIFFVCGASGLLAGVAEAQSLRGSAASLDLQNNQALRHDFTFLRESAQLRRFVGAGLLVQVKGGRDYSLKAVSFPYTRPEVLLFIERLSAQYRRACGEKLIVTSLTRPMSHQPRNASPRSVHPTGMALDLRRPTNMTCRRWLEDTLLQLEDRSVLEATKERGPPHYHVAVFPSAYAKYVSDMLSRSTRLVSATPAQRHTVRRRETLWKISNRYGTTPAQIQRANELRSSLIYPGQVLTIPVHTDAN
jgi:hypothetical protein